MQPSWSIVATVDEPAPLVVAFVLHHLEIGAATIDLFLDAPNPEVQEALWGLPQVRLTLCDDAYWQDGGKRRPKLHPGRQIFNANLAYGRARSDWLLHCDCDEFLRDGRSLGEDLAQTGASRLFLRLAMAERAYAGPETEDLFEGVFRHPIDDFARVGPAIYGDLAPLLKDGITGHKAGKGLLRTGLAVRMGIHAPEVRQPQRTARYARLLHFDGLTRLHYMIKLLRRAHEPPLKTPPRHGAARIAQFERLDSLAADPAGASALVAHLKALSAAQLAELRALGAVDERGFAPLGHNPMAAGLTVSAMNTALRARYHAFLQHHAPGLLQP